MQFSMAEDAQKALKEATAKKFGQRTLKLDLAKHRQRQDGAHDPTAGESYEDSSIKAEAPAEMLAMDAKKAPMKAAKAKKADLTYLRTALVRGLPHDLTKKQLYKKARKYGDIEEIIYPVQIGVLDKTLEPLDAKGHGKPLDVLRICPDHSFFDRF